MRGAADDLRLIRAFGDALTRRQLDVLAMMRDRDAADPGCDEAELVLEGRVAWLGDERVGARAVDALLRACAIRAEHDSHAVVERYRINATGREILTRAGLLPFGAVLVVNQRASRRGKTGKR